jgi:hypothetical protein
LNCVIVQDLGIKKDKKEDKMEINLLPEEQVEKIKMNCLSKKATGLIVLAIFLNVVFGFYIYSLKAGMTERLKEEEARKNTLALKEEVKDLEKFEAEVKKSFDLLEKAKRIQKEEEKSSVWFLILSELHDFWESGIVFSSFVVQEEEKIVPPKDEKEEAEKTAEEKKAEAENKKNVEEKVIYEIILSGKAKERDQVIRLKEKLASSDFYREVISPVSNLTSREDVEFDFTLKLKE